MKSRMTIANWLLIGACVVSVDGHLTRVLGQTPEPAPAKPATESAADSSTLDPVRPKLGIWRAWLDSPGGELPFGLELGKDDRGLWRAWLLNGDDRMVVPMVSHIDNGMILAVDYYDASIVGKLNSDGTRLDGEWKKRGRAEKWPKLPFHATFGEAPRFPAGGKPAIDVSGRWQVKFSDSDATAVGVFDQNADGRVVGTILTPGGDYRFLEGVVQGDQLKLSTFDGAHAFLFHATAAAGPSGTEKSPAKLTGDFWSGDTYHVAWTAEPAKGAGAAAVESISRPANVEANFAELFFKDLDGEKRVLSEPAFAGKARIIEVFGTWCPNCSDAARYLSELDRRYRERGLSVVGLAFEYTGEFARDAKQVKRFAAAHGVEYPLLLGGIADKQKVASALPFLEDGVRAYPTTIFLHGDGRVHSIHSGYVGPASPQDNQHLREEYERIIEEILIAAEAGAPQQDDVEE